jgi:hypothetical protein
VSDKPACCERFKKEASRYQAPVAGGWLYPMTMRPEAQIVYEGGKWHVNGCCGGGCYVINEINFCPFCGEKLAGEKEKL